jgi:hypothetical protein
VRESTVQLSQMVRRLFVTIIEAGFIRFIQNDAFAETSGILSGTFRRMNNMAERQGCRWLWYIVFLVIVFWFFILVWWLRR